jgi:hypothetical protein
MAGMNKTTEKLNKLLSYLDETINLEHVNTVEKMHLATIHYQEVPCLPLTVIFPVDDHQLFPYHEAFSDPEKMLYNELLWSFSSIYNSVRIKDHFPLHIRSNHGVGIIASLFGATCRIINDNMPWVDPLNGLKDLKKLILKGIPENDAGLGNQVLQTYQFFQDKLKSYPKCYQAIKLSQPDLQGPFDIAHLLMGTELFYLIYDHSDLIHELLQIITQTYIRFKQYITPWLNDQASGKDVYAHGCICGGNIIIKDDTAAVTLSENLYREFSKTYNEEILSTFSGGSIHHCGLEREWHFSQFSSAWLKGINYGNPEMHDLDHIYQIWYKHKVPILWWGYNQEYAFVRQCKTKTGVTLACKAANISEAYEIIKHHTDCDMHMGKQELSSNHYTQP